MLANESDGFAYPGGVAVRSGYGDDIDSSFDEGGDMTEQPLLIDGAIRFTDDRDADAAEEAELTVARGFKI